MENKIEKPRVSVSALSILATDGATEKHFQISWERKSKKQDTKGQFRGHYLHAASLTDKIFQEKYYVDFKFDLDEFNEFRIKNNAKPIESIRSDSKFLSEFVELKRIEMKFDAESVKNKIALTQEQSDEISDVKRNFIECLDADIVAMIYNDSNVYEEKHVLDYDGIDISHIPDIYNPALNYMIDLKTTLNRFLNDFKLSSIMGENIFQQAAYNVLLKRRGINIKENYLLIVDGSGIPVFRPYDRYQIKAAESKFEKTVMKFKNCLEHGFKGYSHERTIEGKIHSQSVLPRQLEWLESDNKMSKSDEESFDAFLDQLEKNELESLN